MFDENGDLISQQDGLYLPECQADFGAEATAVSYTFDEGESCGGSSGCDGKIVSDFDMSGLFAGSCSMSFAQVGTATISGGSATINVTWSTNTSGFPDPDTAGTVTLTTDGSTWSWTSGTIPFAGGTTSNTDSPSSSACVGVTSGTNTGSGHTGSCSSSSINGFYSFTVT